MLFDNIVNDQFSLNGSLKITNCLHIANLIGFVFRPVRSIKATSGFTLTFVLLKNDICFHVESCLYA